MNWTEPYYGVQHLKATFPRHAQITVTDYGTSAICWVKRSGGFSDPEINFPNIEQARAHGEAMYRIVFSGAEGRAR